MYLKLKCVINKKTLVISTVLLRISVIVNRTDKKIPSRLKSSVSMAGSKKKKQSN